MKPELARALKRPLPINCRFQQELSTQLFLPLPILRHAVRLLKTVSSNEYFADSHVKFTQEARVTSRQLPLCHLCARTSELLSLPASMHRPKANHRSLTIRNAQAGKHVGKQQYCTGITHKASSMDTRSSQAHSANPTSAEKRYWNSSSYELAP